VRGPGVYLQTEIEKEFKFRIKKKHREQIKWNVMHDKCKLKQSYNGNNKTFRK
jgi:hypothetical protein